MTKVFALITYLVLTISNTLYQDLGFKPTYSVALEVEKGKDLLQQCSRGTPSNVSNYWKVVEADIQLLEANFKKVKKLKSTECCSAGVMIGNLKKFGFQYIGVTIKGKRYIYINAFHIESEDQLERFYSGWETKALIICDGGDYYWGVLFDLQTLKFKDLMFNGVA